MYINLNLISLKIDSEMRTCCHPSSSPYPSTYPSPSHLRLRVSIITSSPSSPPSPTSSILFSLPLSPLSLQA